MEISAGISFTTAFTKFVGAIVADLKREELAKINLELLNLKRNELADRLADYKSQMAKAVAQDEAQAKQDLISRGLGNTTLVNNTLRAIEKNASDEIYKATREYNRAIEEIALLERQVKAQLPWWRKIRLQARPWCRKLFRRR